MEMEDHKHLIFFPFLAPGHINPFLNLAEHLHQHSKKHNKNISITLVSTPRNVVKLSSSLSKDSSIQLAALPFSSDIESTESIPLNLFTSFFESTETSLRAPFERFIEDLVNRVGNSNLCIVSDIFCGWTIEIAEKFDVSHAVFATGGPYGMSVVFSLWVHSPPVSFFLEGSPDDEFNLIHYPNIRLPYSSVINHINMPVDGHEHPINIFLRRQLVLSLRSNAILLNTIEELDKEGLKLLRIFPSLPLWPIGPLAIPAGIVSPSDPKGKECIDFLDSKAANSVLYVSFGSHDTILASQMIDLAKGLQASGKPFIWVIRPPQEFEVESRDGVFKKEWLPEGFEESIKANRQGLLVHNWAPQREILSHVSTGAFLSHCGWNSVLESLCQGVPIIGWPLLADQLYNSSVLEEMGVCVEVARGKFSGGLEKGGWKKVKDAVEMVMENEKGSEMRKKAQEIRDVMRMALRDDAEFKGSSCKSIDGFLQATFHD